MRARARARVGSLAIALVAAIVAIEAASGGEKHLRKDGLWGSIELGHAGEVTAAAFVSSTRCLTGGRDGKLRMWDVEVGREVGALPFENDEVTSLACSFSRQEKNVVVGTHKGDVFEVPLDIRIADPDEVRFGKTRIARVTRVRGEVSTLALSPDRQLCFGTTGEGASVAVVTPAVGPRWLGGEHDDVRVRAIGFSVDPHRVVSGGEWLRVRDGLRGTELWREPNESPTQAIAFSKDAKLALTGGSVGAGFGPRLWDLGGHRIVRELEATSDFSAIAFFPEKEGEARSTRALAACPGHLELWDLELGVRLRRIDGTIPRRSPEGDSNAIAISPEGTFAVTAGRDGRVRIFDLVRGRETKESDASEAGLTEVAAATSGTRALVARWDRSVEVVALPGGERLAKLDAEVEPPVEGEGVHLAISNDGRIAVVASDPPAVFDMTSAQRIRNLEVLEGKLTAIAVSPRGSYALGGTTSGKVALWDLATGKIVARQVTAARAPVLATGFSKNEDAAAVATPDRLLLLSVPDRAWRWGPKLSSSSALAVAFSPHNARYVAVGCRDGGVRIWAVGTGEGDGQVLVKFEGHTGAVDAVAVSPDSNLYASTNVQGTLRLWDGIGKALDTIAIGERATHVAFAEDGRGLVVRTVRGVVLHFRVG